MDNRGILSLQYLIINDDGETCYVEYLVGDSSLLNFLFESCVRTCEPAFCINGSTNYTILYCITGAVGCGPIPGELGGGESVYVVHTVCLKNGYPQISLNLPY